MAISPKWLLLVALFGVGVVGYAWFRCSETREPAPIRLPSPKQIEKIVAKLDDLRLDRGMDGTPEFTLPTQYIRPVMNALRPAGRVRRSLKNEPAFPRVGEFVIYLRTGETITIVLHYVGKTVVGYEVNGISCCRHGEHEPVRITKDYESYANETVLLCDFIRAIYAEQAPHEKGDEIKSRVKEYGENLKRSRGEMDPIRE